MNSSSNQAANKNFRQDINGLRAWAVVAVVLYHFGVPGFTGGFVGVDVFFVISGFLMTSIIVRGLDEGRFSLLEFYFARARRIIPALAALAMALVVVGWFTLPSTDYRLLGKHVAASLAFLSNIVFWLEAGYFDAASKEKWLLHTWSLSVEWQFYLLLPLALLGAWRIWPGRGRLASLVALAFAASLTLSILVSASRPSTAFYLLPARAWEMLAGGLVYLLAHLWPVRTNAKFLEKLGIGTIIASVLVFDGDSNWPGVLALVPVSGAVLVLMAAQTRSPWTGSRMAQWLGNASYSIYLWHWPIAVAITYLELEGKPFAVTTGLALTLGIGHLSYVLIETPVRRRFSGIRGRHDGASLAVATMAIASVGVAIHLNKGFQDRLAPAIEAASQEARNQNPRRMECLGKGATSPSCIYGGDKLGAVVLGDSHAAAIVTAVAAALPSNSYGVLDLSYISCPTFLGVKHYPSVPSSNQCAQFNQWALRKLEAVPKQVPLIIINRTSIYAFGPNEPDRAGEQSPSVYFSKPYESPEPRFLEEFSEHLIDTACTFAQDREVYLVRPIPEMRVNVPKTITREMIRGIKAEVSIPLTDYVERHALVLAAQDEASRRCGVKILDPLPYLCHDGRCYGSQNGRPLYFDDDHLSEFGNRLLTPMFAQVFGSLEGSSDTTAALASPGPRSVHQPPGGPRRNLALRQSD